MNMRKGMMTHTGRWFDAADPKVGDFVIEDIAHALACTNRYGGHVPNPYSVAQHSVLASRMAPDGLELQALMHDAHEAYVLDMPRPLKILLPDYRELENRVEAVVRRAFALPEVFDPRIKDVDIRMMVTEAKAFGFGWWTWYPEHPPYAELEGMTAWPWDFAKAAFKARFRELGG